MLKSGVLYRDKHGKHIKEEYRIELLSIKDLEEVISLQNYVVSTLERKEIFFPDTYDNLYDAMIEGAIILGVYNSQNKLICYRYVKFPKLNRDNLGYDLNLPLEELIHVCNLESTVVYPDYRGNHLQYLTLEALIPLIKEEGAKHMICTISPFNMFSVDNIMKHGLKVKLLKRKYATKDNDGIWRYILHRSFEGKSFGNILDSVISDMEDIPKQIELLNNGYIGFELIRDEKKIQYVKFD